MTQPLSDRSTNTHLANNNGADSISHEKLEDLKSAPANLNSLDYHRQVLQGKLEEGDKYVIHPHAEYKILETNRTRNQASYVSPSDDIMSPCSKKLSDLKGKRFKKYVSLSQPRTLLRGLYGILGYANISQCGKTAIAVRQVGQEEL